MKSTLLIYFLVAAVGISLIIPVYASPIYVFNGAPTLEKSLGTSTISPQIIANGNDIYILFVETNPNDILRFEKTNVNTPLVYAGVDVYDGFGTTLTNPQMFADGSGKIYVGGIEDTGGFGVFIDIIQSTDGGTTFPVIGFGCPGDPLCGIPDGIELSGVPPVGANFKIAADAGTNNVYVGFIDNDVLKFVAATYSNSADLYDLSFPVILVNGGTGGATNMDMIKDGTNVYITWEFLSAGFKEIGFAYSNNNGATWNSINLSNTAGVESSSPKLSVSGANVSIIWVENTGINSEIHFRGSTDSGVTFGADIRLDNPAVTALSATPQIESSGSNVYAVWADNIDGLSLNQEIVMRKSIDSGASFSSAVSISSSTGESSNPRITAQGTNLDVVWQDKTIDAGNGELWFRSSADSGVTFGGLQIITESPGSYPSPVPEIDSSSPGSAIAWKKASFGGNSFVKPATVTNIDVSFDKIEYAKTDIATITVRDASQSGTVNVDVIVGANPANIVTLSETIAGVFTTTVDIDAAPHSATDGDVIKAVYPNSGTLSAFSHVLGTRSIAWTPDNTPLSNTQTYGITVIDQSANLDPFAIDTITVPIITTDNTVTTVLDTDTIQILETDLNSGIFSCTNCVALMPGYLSMSLTDVITVSISDSVAGNPAIVETLNADIKTSSFPAGITITLTETTVSSDVYSTLVNLCTVIACTDAPTNIIYAKKGDFVEIYPSSDPARKVFGVVEPMLPTKRALVTNDNPISNDKVNLSFNGLTVVGNPRELTDPFAPGGGGGGISRAGLVFNAAAGASLFGGGSDFSPPIIGLESLANVQSFDMPDEIRSQIENYDSESIISSYDEDQFDDFVFPLVINSNGFALAGFDNIIETQIVETNEIVEIKFTFYETSEIQHISLFTNLSGGLVQHSDTEIAYDKKGGISILDPHELIDDVSFSFVIDSDDDFIKTGVFEIIFANPMEKSDIIIRSWDEKRYSMDTYIRDAIEVIASESYQENLIEDIVEPEPEIIESEILDEFPEKVIQSIPQWIKKSTLWWSNGDVTDDVFIKGMQFLVQEEIIQIPPTDSEFESLSNFKIPEWIRNTANWWTSDAISDQEFIAAIQFLVKNGIITV